MENTEVEIRDPDEEMYNETKQLLDSVENENIFRKHLPKQLEIEKFLEKLKRKVIHDYHIPLSVKELSHEVEKSPFFRDIYKYIVQGAVPSEIKGNALRRLKLECEDYLVIERVLFRIKLPKQIEREPELLLCIPERYVPQILYQYHDTLLAGHQGVTRMYLTLKSKYYIYKLFESCRNYVQCCVDCQTRMAKDKEAAAQYARIPYDFRPMSRISADVKYMPPSSQGYKFILVITCEVSNYIIGVPLVRANTTSIAEAILNRVVFQFGCPKMVIIDEDRALSSKVMMYIYTKLNIRSMVISPQNHGSLRTERYIKTLSEMLCKHMADRGRDWHLYVNACCYAHNTYVSPTTGFSAFELLYLHKPADLTNLTFDMFQGSSRAAEEYIDLLKQRFEVLKKVVVDKRTGDQEKQLIRQARANPDPQIFAVGDLVYLHAPSVSSLKPPSRKFKQDWVGPLKIQAVLDRTHYTLSDWNGQLLPFFGSVHLARLKPCYVNLGRMEGKVLATASNVKDLEKEWSKLSM